MLVKNCCRIYLEDYEKYVEDLRMALRLLCELQLPEGRFKFVVFQLLKNAVKTALALTVSEINRFLAFTTLRNLRQS